MSTHTTTAHILSSDFGKHEWQTPRDVREVVLELVGSEPRTLDLVPQTSSGSESQDRSWMRTRWSWLPGLCPQQAAKQPATATVGWERIGDTQQFTLADRFEGISKVTTLIMRDGVALGLNITDVEQAVGAAQTGPVVMNLEMPDGPLSADGILNSMFYKLEQYSRFNVSADGEQ